MLVQGKSEHIKWRPALFKRRNKRSGRKKGGKPMVTYTDLIQFCLLMVGLISLCYQIFKDKK